MKYLLRYKGKYRILAHYDLETNDFPRDHLGNIDSSFDDYYIPCKNKSQIYHYEGNILAAYIPSTQRGKNIIAKLNEINPNIAFEFEKYDGECVFKFHSKHIDVVAEIMKAKTNGANISPFSIRNLPKLKYSIPDVDMQEYKKLICQFELKDIRTMFTDFDRFIVAYLKNKSGNEEFDISVDKRLRMLKGKDYIHSIGMWNEFTDFLKSNLNKNENG